jgi:hypothetical protein
MNTLNLDQALRTNPMIPLPSGNSDNDRDIDIAGLAPGCLSLARPPLRRLDPLATLSLSVAAQARDAGETDTADDTGPADADPTGVVIHTNTSFSALSADLKMKIADFLQADEFHTLSMVSSAHRQDLMKSPAFQNLMQAFEVRNKAMPSTARLLKRDCCRFLARDRPELSTAGFLVGGLTVTALLFVGLTGTGKNSESPDGDSVAHTEAWWTATMASLGALSAVAFLLAFFGDKISDVFGVAYEGANRAVKRQTVQANSPMAAAHQAFRLELTQERERRSPVANAQAAQDRDIVALTLAEDAMPAAG